jgi:hypothetical protein
MKSHLTKPHHSYNHLDHGHTPAIYEVNDPGMELIHISICIKECIVPTSKTFYLGNRLEGTKKARGGQPGSFDAPITAMESGSNNFSSISSLST